MKTIIEVESNTLDFYLGYLDDDGSAVNIITEEDCARAAERFNCSAELMIAWFDMLEGLKSLIHADMKDIWLRLDTIEGRIGGK